MTADGQTQTTEALWRAAVTRVLKGAGHDTLVRRSRDGLSLGPLHAACTEARPGPWRDTRRPFGVIQRVEHPDPDAARALALDEQAGGANGLTVTFAGHRAARGFGLAPPSADRLVALLDGIPLDRIALRLDPPPAAAQAVVHAVAGLLDRSGFAPESLDIGLDPLGDLARFGAAAQREAVLAAVGVLRERGVTIPILRVDAAMYHEAGASEAQELAAAIATGVAYLRDLEPLGLDAASGTISFTLAADADLHLTIAKFRALRRLWARIGVACGLAPQPMRLHAETAWRMLARRDPWTNLLRTTLASAGAILGGADSVSVLPFTAALGLPDAFARRLARNTPLVLLEEAHLGQVADPAAGAGSFEAVTTALCHEAWRLFQGLEASGGLAAALTAGTWQAAVAAMREARRAAIAAGEAPLVGVTAYVPTHEVRPAILRACAGDMAEPAPGGEHRRRLPSWRDAMAFEAAEAAPAGEAP